MDCGGRDRVNEKKFSRAYDPYALGPEVAMTHSSANGVDDDMIFQAVANKGSCTYCETAFSQLVGEQPGENILDLLKVAKVGSSYFCFCDDSCWENWLPEFNGNDGSRQRARTLSPRKPLPLNRVSFSQRRSTKTKLLAVNSSSAKYIHLL